MAMTWRGRRQFFIFAIVAGVALFLIYLFIAPSLRTRATCFDGRRNGGETGVDCGGSCALLCSEGTRDLIVRWAQALPVTASTYNAVAYIENQNVGAGIKNISYEFRFYDKSNIFVGSRKGSTFIGPSGQFIIFEPTIQAGNRSIETTLFSFTSPAIWIKADPRAATLPVFVRDIRLTNPESNPRIEATVANDSIYGIFDLDIVALVYDLEGNVIRASKTYLESLPKNARQTVYFTWPELFDRVAGRTDVIVNVNPFKINF